MFSHSTPIPYLPCKPKRITAHHYSPLRPEASYPSQFSVQHSHTPGQKNPSRAYRLVQDLRLINDAVIPIHPGVPNPYTTLSHIPPNTTHFLVLDLKDAFFTIPLHPESSFSPSHGQTPTLLCHSNSRGQSCRKCSEIAPTYLVRL